MTPIRLNERWAVGFIAEPPQYTLDALKVRKGQEEWEHRSFCQFKSTLLRAIREKVTHGADYYPGAAKNMRVDPEAMILVMCLPDKAKDKPL